MASSQSTKRKSDDDSEEGPSTSSSKVWIVRLTSDSTYEIVPIKEEQDASSLAADPSSSGLNVHETVAFLDDDSLCSDDEYFHDSESIETESSGLNDYQGHRFLKRWLTEFPFLEYDAVKDLMFCKLCRKFVDDPKKNGQAFVLGSKNYRATTIRAHQQSAMHAKSQELADNLAAQTPQNGDSFGSGDGHVDESPSNPKNVERKCCWRVDNLRFLKEWCTEFPFLGYDEKKNLMFCQVCRKFVNDWRKNGPFVLGTNNFRVSMIRYHQRSAMHAECQKLAETLVAQDSEAMGKDLFKEQLGNIFKSAYFIYKNKLPYLDFPLLCQTQKILDTDFPVYSNNPKACALFGKFICMAFEKELAQKICDVSEFALVCDGSFKRNIESHDLVYIKFIRGLTVQTVFLGVIDSSAKLHKSVFDTLSDLFKRYEVDKWFTKVVYVMTDKSDSHLWLEGLVDIIDSMSAKNFISDVKYLPHKVRFCANIVQSHQSTSTLDALLWSMYCYYEKLDVSYKNLIHMNQELKNLTDFYGKLPKNCFTTLYYESLKAVEQDWAEFVNLIREKNQLQHGHHEFKVRKSGHRILYAVTRSSFLYKMAVMLDFFDSLSNFARKLGNDSLLPYDIHILLEEVCLNIAKTAKGEGPMTVQISEELSGSPGYFRGIEIRDDGSIPLCLSGLKKFSDDLICYLKSLIDNTLLEKSYIFNVNLWPDGSDLSAFGDTEFVDIFLCFNGDESEVESAVAEWKSFKDKVSGMFPSEVREDSKSVILKMVAEAETEFPLVISVLKKILLLNFETTEITRGYHEMCLNKSHYRSVLSPQSLQTMMMVSMYGPPLGEVDFSLAYQLFLNGRHRKFRKKIIDNKMNNNYSEDESYSDGDESE